jgi:hypothetical protein
LKLLLALGNDHGRLFGLCSLHCVDENHFVLPLSHGFLLMAFAFGGFYRTSLGCGNAICWDDRSPT